MLRPFENDSVRKPRSSGHDFVMLKRCVIIVALAVVPFAMSTSIAAMAATKTCKVPKSTITYGRWSVELKSFARDGSKLIKPPAGRVTMALDVVVSTTKAGDSPGRLLDINLQPIGGRRYRGTIVAGEAAALKAVEPNEKVAYTLVYPVEIKDKNRKLAIELNDFSGSIADEKLVPIC
jgi:hypothetical protein